MPGAWRVVIECTCWSLSQYDLQGLKQLRFRAVPDDPVAQALAAELRRSGTTSVTKLLISSGVTIFRFEGL